MAEIEKPELTLDQIKRMLKPMADFAPAFLAGQKILQSFEAADKGLREFEKRQAEIERGITKAEGDKAKAENDARLAREKTAYAKAELLEMESRVAAATAELNTVGAELGKARAKIENELDSFADGAKKEMAALTAQIEAKKAEHAAAERAFANWRKEHGL